MNATLRKLAMTQSSTTLCAPAWGSVVAAALSTAIFSPAISPVTARSQDLIQLLQTRLAERQAIAAQIESLIQQLEQTPDTTTEIQGLEQQLQRRRQLDLQLGELGRLQQVFNQLERNRIQ